MVNDLNAKASYLLDTRHKHFSVISPRNVWVILCNYLLIAPWTQTSLRENVEPLPQRPSFPYSYTRTFTSVCSLSHLGLVCFLQLILNKKLWSGYSAFVGIGCFVFFFFLLDFCCTYLCVIDVFPGFPPLFPLSKHRESFRPSLEGRNMWYKKLCMIYRQKKTKIKKTGKSLILQISQKLQRDLFIAGRSVKYLQRKAAKINSWKLGPRKGNVYGFIWPGEKRTIKWHVGIFNA